MKFLARGMFLATMSLMVGPAGALHAAEHKLPEARDSVVWVQRIVPGEPAITASGFFLFHDGTIITSRRVVESVSPDSKQSPQLLVGVLSPTDAQRLEYFPASVVFVPDAASRLDFAAIKIRAADPERRFRQIDRRLRPPEANAKIAVLGYPLSEEPAGSVPLMGKIRSPQVTFGGHLFSQTDVIADLGYHGGPLLNQEGEVCGIVTLQDAGAENVAYALQLKEVSGLLPQIFERIAGGPALRWSHPTRQSSDAKYPGLPRPSPIPASGRRHHGR